MALDNKSANIFKSFKRLRGNTRIAVLFEPMWAIPYAFCSFYLSLYMKSQGITDKQIGFLISIGFISGSIFSLFSGAITDALGRKKTTLIFDLICWPCSMLIYMISNSFWMFALAAVSNSFLRIVTVSWHLLVIEDADNEQRVAAFNILNIITIGTGIITPLAGLVVKRLGVVNAERIFLGFAVVSMTTMMLLRNIFSTETKVGQQILDKHGKKGLKSIFQKGLYRKTFAALIKKPEAILIMSVMILFNIYLPIGAYSSLYFAPYMTEVLGIDKSAISILGGVNSAVMLLIFIFVTPIISRGNKLVNMISGLIIQAVSLGLLIIIPANNLIITIFCIALFAVGFSIFRPFIDAVFAELTEGSERAGIYSLYNTITSVLSIVVGLASGYLYVINPRLLYIISIIILTLCITILILMLKKQKTFSHSVREKSETLNVS